MDDIFLPLGTDCITEFIRSPNHAQKNEQNQKKCKWSDYLPNTAKVACVALHSTAQEDTIDLCLISYSRWST